MEKSPPAKKSTPKIFLQNTRSQPRAQHRDCLPSEGSGLLARRPEGLLGKPAPAIESRVPVHGLQQIELNCFTVVAQMSLSRYFL